MNGYPEKVKGQVVLDLKDQIVTVKQVEEMEIKNRIYLSFKQTLFKCTNCGENHPLTQVKVGTEHLEINGEEIESREELSTIRYWTTKLPVRRLKKQEAALKRFHYNLYCSEECMTADKL